MKTRIPALALHLLFSLAFLALPYVFAPQGFSTLLQLGSNPHERTALASYLLMLGAFYLNYYLLIPRFFFQKKYTLFVAILVGCFMLIVLTLVGLDRRDLVRPRVPVHGVDQTDRPSPPPDGRPGSLPPPPLPAPEAFGGREKPPFGFELSHTLFLFLVGLFVSLSLRINQRFRRVEQEKTATELAYLKAQINPHFLFNTLNSIYALALEKSDRTAEAVVKLSAMMRYVIREASTERVPLARELEYIANYVALQKLRLDDSVPVEFSTEGRPNGAQIAPLVLISFIENAFKYGVNPQVAALIRIGLVVTGSTLRLHVFNKKVRVAPSDETSGGIGLENTRARLHLLYPNRHELTIQETDEEFVIDLKMQL